MSQSISRTTGALSSGKIQHQTGCAAPEANEILSLAKLVLSTLNFFPGVTHIGSAIIVVAFTTCTSSALTELWVAQESIKTVLHCIYYIIIGNSKSCNIFERFSPNAQAPCKCKH